MAYNGKHLAKLDDLKALGTKQKEVADAQCLQVVQFCQMFSIVSHNSYPPVFSVIYSP